jgi:hypothetical protein
VRAAQRVVAAAARAASTAQMVHGGALTAVMNPSAAAARRVAARAGAVFAAGLWAAQTGVGRSAIQWVRGHYRTDSLGRTAYVRPHERRVG